MRERVLLGMREDPLAGTIIDTLWFWRPSYCEIDCPTFFFFCLQQYLAAQESECPRWTVVDPSSGLAGEFCQKDRNGSGEQGIWASGRKEAEPRLNGEGTEPASLWWARQKRKRCSPWGQRAGVVRRKEAAPWMGRRDCDRKAGCWSVKLQMWSSYRYWL